MEHIDDLMESSSKDSERVEAMDLLEESWFFGNLLNRRARMLRCHSDPCPTSLNFCENMLVKYSNGETRKKSTEGDTVQRTGLLRTPSLPPCIGRGKEIQEKESNPKMNKKLIRQFSHQNFSLFQASRDLSCLNKKEDRLETLNDSAKSKNMEKPSRPTLLRAPSLPPGIGREASTPEKQSDPKLTKLTRQASLNPSDLLPPRRSSKGMTQNSGKHRPPRNLEVESINSEGAKEMRRRYLNQRSMKKSLNDLEHEELQGFKDLGFSFDKESLDPSVVNILPGLQEKKRHDLEQQEKVQRPYLSEAWLVQSCAPPVPSWVAKNSAEDVKAHIKFWARNVASNVRQEC